MNVRLRISENLLLDKPFAFFHFRRLFESLLVGFWLSWKFVFSLEIDEAIQYPVQLFNNQQLRARYK